ncbi:MAG: nitrilase-related carbon-nitrogen hydrolase [Vulcanimicrobiota bacterium]
MKVYLLQRSIEWEDPSANFDAIDSELAQAPPERESLLVLAEMFSTGFSLALDKVGEPEAGPSSEFLRYLSQKYGTCTVGSFPYRPLDEEKGLNRLMAYYPDGTPAVAYDKIHPFSYGKEADFYRGGTCLPLFGFRGWTICPTVCYDLRFPEMYRRAAIVGGADLLLCIANWPTPRRDHWNTLLRARAIENQAVMVAVNRVGQDPLNDYSGESAVVDARGRELLSLGEQAAVGCTVLDREELLEWRARFPALTDATEQFELLRCIAEDAP